MPGARNQRCGHWSGARAILEDRTIVMPFWTSVKTTNSSSMAWRFCRFISWVTTSMSAASVNNKFGLNWTTLTLMPFG